MNQAFLKQHFCREKIYISGKMHLFICTLQIRAKNFKEYRFYCSDGYGTMLWNLRSDYCEKYLKFSKHGMYKFVMPGMFYIWPILILWSIILQLDNQVWEHKLSENIQNLYKNYFSFQVKKFVSWVKFYLMIQDQHYARKECLVSKWPDKCQHSEANKLQMKNVIPVDPIPVNDQWHTSLLKVLLETRNERKSSKLNLTTR